MKKKNYNQKDRIPVKMDNSGPSTLFLDRIDLKLIYEEELKENSLLIPKFLEDLLKKGIENYELIKQTLDFLMKISLSNEANKDENKYDINFFQRVVEQIFDIIINPLTKNLEHAATEPKIQILSKWWNMYLSVKNEIFNFNNKWPNSLNSSFKIREDQLLEKGLEIMKKCNELHWKVYLMKSILSFKGEFLKKKQIEYLNIKKYIFDTLKASATKSS